MDLNQLLADHQTALMRAGEAATAGARALHRRQVAYYAERIAALRVTMRATAPILRPFG